VSCSLPPPFTGCAGAGGGGGGGRGAAANRPGRTPGTCAARRGASHAQKPSRRDSSPRHGQGGTIACPPQRCGGGQRWAPRVPGRPPVQGRGGRLASGLQATGPRASVVVGGRAGPRVGRQLLCAGVLSRTALAALLCRPQIHCLRSHHCHRRRPPAPRHPTVVVGNASTAPPVRPGLHLADSFPPTGRADTMAVMRQSSNDGAAAAAATAAVAGNSISPGLSPGSSPRSGGAAAARGRSSVGSPRAHPFDGGSDIDGTGGVGSPAALAGGSGGRGVLSDGGVRGGGACDGDDSGSSSGALGGAGLLGRKRRAGLLGGVAEVNMGVTGAGGPAAAERSEQRGNDGGGRGLGDPLTGDRAGSSTDGGGADGTPTAGAGTETPAMDAAAERSDEEAARRLGHLHVAGGAAATARPPLSEQTGGSKRLRAWSGADRYVRGGRSLHRLTVWGLSVWLVALGGGHSLHVCGRFRCVGDSRAPNGAPADRPRGGAHARSVGGCRAHIPPSAPDGGLWGGGGCLERRHPAPHFLGVWWADSCAPICAAGAPPPRARRASAAWVSCRAAAEPTPPRRRPRPGAVCRPQGRKTPARRGVAPVTLACAVAGLFPATTPVTVVTSAAAARTRPGRQRRGCGRPPHARRGARARRRRPPPASAPRRRRMNE